MNALVYLFGELERLDLDERGGHRLHEGLLVVERHPAGPDRVLVLVRVDTWRQARARSVGCQQPLQLLILLGSLGPQYAIPSYRVAPERVLLNVFGNTL